MSISSSVEKTRDLTIFTVEAELTYDDAISALREFYEAPPTMNMLWDLSKIQGSSLTEDERISILQFVEDQKIKRPTGKTALVTDVYYDRAKRMEGYGAIKNLPWNIRAFRSMERAIIWLDEDRFQIMADNLPVSVWVHNADGEQEFVNRTFRQFFGVDEGETSGMNWERLVHPSDEKQYSDEFMACIRDRRDFHAEARALRGDGEWRWVESRGQPWFSSSGKFLGMVGASIDITERKKAEASLREIMEDLETKVHERTEELNREVTRRKALSKRLVEILEQDRRDITLSLHDDFGQHLVGEKMKLEELCREIKGKDRDEKVDELLAEMKTRLAGMIQDVREISRELWPANLEKLGLVSALHSLKERFRRIGGFSIDLYTRNQDERFDPNVELALYRIAQEALTNIMKHAQATSANINFIKIGETYQLTIEDNGVGFDPEDPEHVPLGLLIMEERARLCEGELIVESAPGKGTVVIARMPLQC